MSNRHFIAATAVFGLGLSVAPAHAVPPTQASEKLEQLDGVEIVEKLGAQIPDLQFKDSGGEQVALRSLFDGERPVLLTLNYSDCPMLCSLQINALTEAMNKIEWQVGKEYKVITVSLDPKETSDRAAQTKERYVNQLNHKNPEGWSFLTGDEKSIRALADAVGFGYRYSQERQEYLHGAALMVMSPQGKVSRYLYGVTYSPQTMRLSMAEASQGKQVSTLDAFVLYCFYYDANAGNYTPMVRNILKAGAVLTIILLGLFVGMGWRRKNRRKSADAKKGVEGHVAHI